LSLPSAAWKKTDDPGDNADQADSGRFADYLRDVGLKVRYLHSDIDAIERVEILRGLRAADYRYSRGINLLREGLDLPEVSLYAILTRTRKFSAKPNFVDQDRGSRRASRER